MIAKLAAIGLRGTALASRFLFMMVGVFFMTPEDFGIYGVVVAVTLVIAQIVGLEAFQTSLRKIVRANTGDRPDAAAPDEGEKLIFGRFVIGAAVVAFALGAAVALALGWTMPLVLLTGAICAVEYLCVEIMRVLVAEERPNLALISVSCRFTFWALGFPLLGVLGVLPDLWEVEWVLMAWLISGACAALFVWPVSHAYLGPLQRPFWPWMRDVARVSPKWLAIALNTRYFEGGVRLLPAFIIGEAAAGNFTFLTTLASVGIIAMRSVVEPFWFTRLIHSKTGAGARATFRKITLAVLTLAALATFAGWWVIETYTDKEFLPYDSLILVQMLIALALVSLSQVPHYALYAQDREDLILWAALVSLSAGLGLGVWLTLSYGLVGTAAGTLVGAILNYGLKAEMARRISS